MSKTTVASFEAIPAEQDGNHLYIGVAKAKDLVALTTVDYYNPELDPTDDDQGYQRPPERSRITKIGRYLIEGEGDRLFPTAVLLASRTKLEYDKKEGKISVSSKSPLQIVDGQHRLAGLKYAIEEKSAAHLENFHVPFVIIETPDRLVEMTQFRIVNGTAKQVRTDLVNMILTATYSGMKRTEIPEKVQWKIVVSNVVDRLAKSPETPWYGLIALPGESTSRSEGGKTVRATSLITSMQPVYVWLKDVSGILNEQCRSMDDEIEYMVQLMSDYWSAIKEVVPEAFENPSGYVIQKTPGIFSLHLLLRHLLGNMFRGRRKFDKFTFVEFLKESPEIRNADYWSTDSKGPSASVYGSMKGFQELYETLSVPYQ